MTEKSFLRVAVEATRGALEGTLSHDVSHIFQEEEPRFFLARGGRGHAAVVMGQQVLAHLATADSRVAHFARYHSLLSFASFRFLFWVFFVLGFLWQTITFRDIVISNTFHFLKSYKTFYLRDAVCAHTENCLKFTFLLGIILKVPNSLISHLE